LNRPFTSKDPAQWTWGSEEQIKRQTKKTGQKHDGRGDSLKDKDQGKHEQKEKIAHVLHFEQRASNASSAEFCSIEIVPNSPRNGCTQQTACG